MPLFKRVWMQQQVANNRTVTNRGATLCYASCMINRGLSLFFQTNRLWICAFLLLGLSNTASAASLQQIANGFSSPLYVTSPPGDTSRLFVLEKNSGQIKIIRLAGNTVVSQPFLTVSRLGNSGEGGLLGLAFHPNYASNQEFYVSMTNSNGDSEIRRYSRSSNPDVALSSDEVLLTIPQFASNHNGGWIGFGPDGYLYIAIGDGGSGNDPNKNGQDLTTLLATMLRIDVNGDDFPADSSRNYRIPPSNPFISTVIEGVPARPEIWAYGLRNPWRASFDRSSGDLLIADVGQGEREEVNFQQANSGGGENYGWRLREGDIATPNVGGPRPADNVDPIYAYSRNGSAFSGRSVTGGYRYRGPVAETSGLYFFGDFAEGRIWSLIPQAGGFSQLTDWTSILKPDQGQVNSISSFGEDAHGNLYVVDFDGEIFKLVGDVTGTENEDGGIVLPAVNLLFDE